MHILDEIEINQVSGGLYTVGYMDCVNATSDFYGMLMAEVVGNVGGIVAGDTGNLIGTMVGAGVGSTIGGVIGLITCE
jgi:hypothetical protein